VEGYNFFDIADAAFEVFAEGDDLANDDGRSRDGLHDAKLAALDALGDLDFALAGEQRNGAHLAEVHAYRVVGLFKRPGSKVKLDIIGLFTSLGLIFVAISAELRFAGENVDTLGVDGGEKIVEIVGSGDVTRQQVIDLAIGEVPLLLTCIDHLVYIFFVLVNFFSHGDAHSCERFCCLGCRRRPWWYSSGAVPWL